MFKNHTASHLTFEEREIIAHSLFVTAPSGSSAHPAPALSIARIVFNGIVQLSVKSIPWYPALLLQNQLMSVIPAIASPVASMKKPIIAPLLHTRTVLLCVRNLGKASIWNPGSLQNWMTWWKKLILK